VKRGEIYLADLGEPVGHEQALRRPVLIVSSDQWLLTDPPVVTVVPLTRSHRRRSSHVEIEPGTAGSPTSATPNVRTFEPSHQRGSSAASVRLTRSGWHESTLF